MEWLQRALLVAGLHGDLISEPVTDDDQTDWQARYGAVSDLAVTNYRIDEAELDQRMLGRMLAEEV